MGEVREVNKGLCKTRSYVLGIVNEGQSDHCV